MKKETDINNHRALFTQLQNLIARAQNAHGAHANGFESNVGFFAAVLAAHFVAAPQGYIDFLAVAFVLSRILFNYFYLSGKGSYRSAFWTIGFLCTLGLFVIGAF